MIDEIVKNGAAQLRNVGCQPRLELRGSMAVRMWSKGQDLIIHNVFDPIQPPAAWRDACRQPGLLAVMTSANTGSKGPPDNRAQLLVPVNLL